MQSSHGHCGRRVQRGWLSAGVQGSGVGSSVTDTGDAVNQHKSASVFLVTLVFDRNAAGSQRVCQVKNHTVMGVWGGKRGRGTGGSG